MIDSQKTGEKESYITKLINFLYRNRFILLGLLIMVIVFIVGSAVFFELRKGRIEKSTRMVEMLEEDYRVWEAKEEGEDKNKLEENLTTSLKRIIEKYPRLYAAQRAYILLANISFNKEEWDKAAEYFITLSESFPESYLAPVGLANAAISYEAKGEIDNAVETLQILANTYSDTFPEMPHIYFNLGRLYEEIKDYSRAAESYKKLIDNYSNSNWTKLAKDRIIFLTVEGKIQE